MFVVLTVFSVWIGWQAKIVRDRREASRGIETLNGGIVNLESIATSRILGMQLPRIPFWRVWMGDQRVGQLILPYAYDVQGENAERVTGLFPETAVTEVSWTSLTVHLDP